MTPTGANHPFQYLAYVHFLAQEILLDAATPGTVAKERLTRNCKLLLDTCQSWGSYWNVDMEAQIKALYKVHPNSLQEAKGKEQGKGKKR